MAARRDEMGPGQIRTGSRVVLLVSEGAPSVSGGYVAVPDVVGMTQANALSALQEQGFEVRVLQDWSYAPSIRAGVVQGQSPASGSTAPSGSTAVLMVAKGAPQTERAAVMLPRVIGKSEAEGVDAVTRSALEPEVVRVPMDAVTPGVVGAQLPDDRTLSAAAALKSKSTWWIWLVIAAVLIAAGALAYSAFTRPVAVPNVVGMPQAAAETALEDAGLKVGQVTAVPSNEATPGTVVQQKPVADSEIARGSAVDLVVAGGAETVEVPDVTGLAEERATNDLEDAGFGVAVTEAYSDSVDAGDVISQTPAAGSQAVKGSAVAIVVSLGAEKKNVTVPDVSGVSADDAESQLTALGLDTTKVEQYSDTVAKGTVIGTLPSAGSSVAPGTEVAILVSAGAQPSSVETVMVPSVKGQTIEAAKATLEGLGFVVKQVEVSSQSVPAKQVIEQYPAASTDWPKGEDVVLLVSKGKAQ